MAGTVTSAGPEPRTARALPFAPALDGLRAIAVIAVLLYHGGVDWMPGGFLGVDLFFCLSGYLITSLLLAELRGTGRIDLKAFWLRRARRLLPAAFLVIAVSVAAAAILVPGDLAQTRGDAVASFFYVDNWHQLLVGQSYFAAFERPSLLRHMWSLSIEEQFYVLWPLALGFGLARLGTQRTALAALGAALLSAALMALLFTSGSDPSRVYYGTDTHAVGLLFGATLAFVWPLGRFQPPRRAVGARGARRHGGCRARRADRRDGHLARLRRAGLPRRDRAVLAHRGRADRRRRPSRRPRRAPAGRQAAALDRARAATASTSGTGR